jgi:two-component system, chemotaxis family, chemotaxis protein CheY
VRVKVLIVEDSPTGRSVLRRRLEEIGCEIVGEAGNASEGLELFRTLHPQLVTLDLLMPQSGEVDAKLLFRSIREEAPEAAVVVISAHPKANEQAEYMGNGALAFFQKPVDFKSLVSKLKQIFPQI